MDKFVRNIAVITITLLAIIFLNAYIGTRYLNNKFTALDDTVETMIVDEHGGKLNPHSILELPGDAEVGAFTVAALGAGIIIGFLWRKIFYENAVNAVEE